MPSSLLWVMALGLGWALSGGSAIADAGQAASPPHLTCNIGPVMYPLAGHDWIVDSCDDGKALVFITPKDNPAASFYFVAQDVGGHYTIAGEGNGNKAASDAAYAALSAMTTDDFRKILAETKAVHLTPR